VLESQINSGPLDQTCGKKLAAGDSMTLKVTSPGGTHALHPGALALQLHDASAPPISFGIPGLHIGVGYEGLIPFFGLSPSGFSVSLVMPAGFGQTILRWQAIALMPNPGNGLFATTNAHDLWLE